MDAPGRLYLDHAATSPLVPEARAAMLAVLDDNGANPSGLHGDARRARRALDDARDALAGVLGCSGDEVVFTSGATEADNLALCAVSRPGGLVCSAIEHAAVLRPAERLGAALVAVGPDGLVEASALAGLLDSSTELVSVMAVNSEVGVVQPLAELCALVRGRAPDALVHSDAAQALPFCDIAGLTADCDLVSVSGHKFGAPKGIGALVVRERARPRLRPLLLGGGQESELRAGTQNVAGAVAMAAAAVRAAARRAEVAERTAACATRLAAGIAAVFPRAEVTAPGAPKAAGTCHVRFPGVDAEELVLVLDRLGLSCSTGSACASGATDPSHVLLAMGFDKAAAREAVRFSLGPDTGEDEVDAAIGLVAGALARLGA